MKTTKKCAALFAAFVMALSLGLTACGDSDDDNGSGGGNTEGGVILVPYLAMML